MKKDWKKEGARDFLAIGSWVFFIIIVARLGIGPYFPEVWQYLTAGVVLAVLLFVFKDADGYAARGTVLAILTSLFYNDKGFAIFAAVAFFFLSLSIWYLGKKCRHIIYGVLLGLASTGVGYYLFQP